MNLTDNCRDEKQRILNWAKKNSCEKNNFLANNGDKDSSYFVCFDNRKDWMEYGFSTVPQLKAALNEMWTGCEYMQDIIMPCSIGAIKAKPIESSKDDRSLTKKESEDLEIKEFVYMF